jgi:hypothetical protein
MADLKTYTITLPDGTKTQRALSNKDMAQFLQNNSGDSLYDQAITLAKPDSMDLRAISDMDLNRYKELSSPETSVEQRAMSDADKQAILDTMTASPVSPLELSPLYNFEKNLRGAAMNFMGPSKFKGIFNLLPKNITSRAILEDYRNVAQAIQKLSSKERDEAIDSILPSVKENIELLSKTYSADVLSNPNASKQAGTLLNKNLEYAQGLVEHLQKLKGMKTGGLATLL